MRGQRLLDVRARDVLPAADDDVLRAAVQVQVAIAIQVAKISGMQPAVNVDGVVVDHSEVAGHHSGRAQQHLAHAVSVRFVDAQLGYRIGPTDGSRALLQVAVARHRHEATGFGHAPGVGQAPPLQLRQLGPHPIQQGRRQRCTAQREGSQRGQVALVEVRVLQHPRGHRGHATPVCDLLGLDKLQHPPGVELAVKQDQPAADDQLGYQVRHAADVE